MRRYAAWNAPATWNGCANAKLRLRIVLDALGRSDASLSAVRSSGTNSNAYEPTSSYAESWFGARRSRSPQSEVGCTCSSSTIECCLSISRIKSLHFAACLPLREVADQLASDHFQHGGPNRSTTIPFRFAKRYRIQQFYWSANARDSDKSKTTDWEGGTIPSIRSSDMWGRGTTMERRATIFLFCTQPVFCESLHARPSSVLRFEWIEDRSKSTSEL
jgi:hypothetical protein